MTMCFRGMFDGGCGGGDGGTAWTAASSSAKGHVVYV